MCDVWLRLDICIGDINDIHECYLSQDQNIPMEGERLAHSRRWKEKVWLIIEDGGIYEMVADEKGYLK